MALVPKNSATPTTNPNLILFNDITGEYDATTNPTGFGTPNPDRADVTAVSLSVLKPNSTTALVVDVLPFPYRLFRLNTVLYVTPDLFGGSVIGTEITGASNATPIVITTDTAHGLTTGQNATVQNVIGNLAANGYWQTTVLTSTTFSLDGSAGSGADGGSGEDAVTRLATQTDFVDGVWKFDIATTIDSVDYTTTTYYLHTALIECCISKEVARAADAGCKNFDKYAEYENTLQYARDAFDCGLYDIAQDTIDRLTKLCNCDCGC